MSDETTADLTAPHPQTVDLAAIQDDPMFVVVLDALLADNTPAIAREVINDALYVYEALAAAGFGPVRAVEAERAARAFVVEAMQEAGHDLEQAWARAESAEAALTGVVAGVRKWCAINEIAEPPLDWAGLGEFLDRAPTPDREEARDE